MAKPYSLVDYGEAGTETCSTELVPTSWLVIEEGQQFCWWPPKSIAMAAAVKKKLCPASSWKQHLVTRVVLQFGK